MGKKRRKRGRGTEGGCIGKPGIFSLEDHYFDYKAIVLQAFFFLMETFFFPHEGTTFQ